ncbi:MAG TPA: DUF421 domain-containing protein [Bacillota bacterium]|nr:DUF421 domain-containing protein [Bacillota bacterium]
MTVLVLIRLMGKREIGQLSAFDLVVAIMIAEIAILPMEQPEMPLYVSLIPMFTLVGAEMLFSYLSLKSHRFRRLVNGSPSIVVYNGEIMEQEMRRLRYNVNDLLAQMRENNVTNIAEVEYAILETSGELSVILKPEHRPLTRADLKLPAGPSGLPVPLIFDGVIQKDNLEQLGMDPKWLEEKLAQGWQAGPGEVLYAGLNPDGTLYVSLKENCKSRRKG